MWTIVTIVIAVMLFSGTVFSIQLNEQAGKLTNNFIFATDYDTILSLNYQFDDLITELTIFLIDKEIYEHLLAAMKAKNQQFLIKSY